MNRFVLLACLAGLLSPMGVLAQKVYINNDRVILDMTEVTGMPTGAVTDESKTEKYLSYTPTIGELGEIDNEANTENHPLNATVYRKLEIAPYDLIDDGEIGNNTTVYFTWEEAFNYCKNVDHSGKGWRLPTQRELQIIYIFFSDSALKNIFSTLPGGGSAFETTYPNNSYYWSSTESDGTDYLSWYLNFNMGYSSNDVGKEFPGKARCVREVAD